MSSRYAYQQLPRDLTEGAVRRAQGVVRDAKSPMTYRILLIVAGVVTLAFAAFFAFTKAQTEDDVHQVKLSVVLAALAAVQAFKMLYALLRPKSDKVDAHCLSKMTRDHAATFILFGVFAIACALLPFPRYRDIEVALPIEFELLFGTYVCLELMRVPNRLHKAA